MSNEPMEPGDDAPEGTPGVGEDVCRRWPGRGRPRSRRSRCSGVVEKGIGGG